MTDLVNKFNNRSYTQALKSNIKEILKIKDAFPKLSPVVVTTSLRTTNRLLSKLKNIISCKDYKRTQQGVFNELLLYLYNIYIVYANNK